MNEIPTPRTDKAIIGRDVNKASMVYAEFARTLERELIAAQKDLANLFPVGPEGPWGPCFHKDGLGKECHKEYGHDGDHEFIHPELSPGFRPVPRCDGPEGPDGPGPGPKGQPLQFGDLVAARRPLIEALLEAISTTSQCAYHLAELQEPPRRIIQISAASETEDRYQSVFALCNDGTVWRVVNRPSPEDCYWASFPPIPQGKI